MTAATEFAPYPAQQPDVSYGFGDGLNTAPLIGLAAPDTVLVPTSGPLPAYTQIGFDDSDWTAGVTGVGYDREPNYLPLIGTDVRDAMDNQNTTALIRVPFTASD